MEKEIVEMLCRKYNEKENVIKILLAISFQKGYNLKESEKLIDKFYLR